ncbi:MAG: O-antigen ligase family protein [Candidatus Andeanibacterium colombiense]|uniref:O-antigen ligase family protein n=1 Tax=Candidatus Andeanibacterium colombiense TaxID=3121345 RepID=A0AAJ6BND2_9SPHN|nr:MAG: O-antigen ligase family protein [Sphingomonadaceae bacterium]
MRLKAFDPSHRHACVAATLLVAAMLLGGGGSPSPAAELAIEVLAGIAALIWFWLPGTLRLPIDWRLWMVAAFVIGLTGLQLIPLPPTIWQSLPGRDIEIAALKLVGEESSWQPFTTSPPRTLASLLALVPPIFVLLMTGALRRSERRWLVAATAAMALVSVIVGAIQLNAGSQGFKFYDQSPSYLVLGFQANRNSTADILLIGLVALAAYRASLHPEGETFAFKSLQKRWWFGSAAMLIGLACVLTASRSGILLLPATLIASFAIVRSSSGERGKRSLGVIAAGGFIFAGVASILLRDNPLLNKIAERFDHGSGREALWKDTIYAIKQFWPFGSGTGTFVPNFIAFEPLQSVDYSVPNRAHNDYLELALESGMFGIAILAAVAGMILWMAIQSSRDSDHSHTQSAFGIVALAIFAVHSVVDYPLRSISLACLAAVSVGLLARAPQTRLAAGKTLRSEPSLSEKVNPPVF